MNSRLLKERMIMKRTIILFFLSITFLLLVFGPVSAETIPNDMKVSSFVTMQSTTGLHKTIGLVETKLEVNALKSLTKDQIDKIGRVYLDSMEVLNSCDHAWVLVKTQYVWYSGPGPDGYYEGWAWVADYECSRCGALQTIVMI